MLNLNQTVVVVPSDLSYPETKAVTMLVEEVQKRTQIRWPVVEDAPAGEEPAIQITRAEGKPEGYSIRVMQNGKALGVEIAGNDTRGVLFGIGRLLRNLRMGRQQVAVPADLDITSAPHSPLRGHQLGYRPKTNSYDAWDLPLWEQYIRDLAVFGANAVELIPPRSDDDADSPHFPLPPMEMMIGMSRLLDEYGLDVWIWYPAMDPDYSDPSTVAFALQEWGEVFRQLPRVDAVFVPGGDPGHTEPKVLMEFLAQVSPVLHEHHTQAQMWVAPQGFTQAWLETFLTILQQERPDWLNGVVFGPQVRIPLPRLRELVPEQYPIRHYPDITHMKECQYPVPDWDWAYALTEGRESINPRPLGQAQIARALQRYTIGSITYSEGCNDDVNKAIWSALEWDPHGEVIEILREYSRYFVGEQYTDTFAQGLLALERNWQAPLLTNEGVTTTLQQFQAMERTASPQTLLNWRFQQGLYRAYYDAFVRRRLLYEQDLEEQTTEVLRRAPKIGSLAALEAAEDVLDRAATPQVALDWRARIFELAEALFQSIRMQLSVERYQAIHVERGANLDSVDVPLNNRIWLKQQFASIRQEPDEVERLQQIDRIVHWTDPGPGGFYDEPGHLARRDHLLGGHDFAADPGCYESTRIGFSDLPGRLAWGRHAETLYDTPLTMRYTHLDPRAAYGLRIVYGGDDGRKLRLVANDTLEIHPYLAKPLEGTPLEFDLPPEATDGGELTLSWTREPGLGGNGRGCMVSEIWLLRK